MFGINYFKASPTQHVFHYSSGKLTHDGRGLAFLYFAPTARLVAVPLASSDVPFAATGKTADFQQVAVQGQVTYQIDSPQIAASTLDFEVDSNGAQVGDGLEALRQRLVNVVQVLVQGLTGRMSLPDALVARDTMSSEVLSGLTESAVLSQMGVKVLNLDILSVSPTPEMARALEAETREGLQRKADQSIYERRNAAVDQERMIKENELRTEIAVEEKRRQIRETQMAADIALEEQRSNLIETRTKNERTEAETRAYAIETSLKPLRDVDWRTLLAASGLQNDPRFMIAIAFRELAENAHKIGELNVSPDLLRSLLSKEKN